MLSRRTLPLFSVMFVLASSVGRAQQMDMEAMMRWASADVVRYHVVGTYQGQTYIAGDGSGLGDVTDLVVIDLTWKLSESKLVGVPKFQNSKSAVIRLRDREPSCLPPILKGEYEHYELLGIKDGSAGALELQVRTTFPLVEVAQSCTASRKAVLPKVSTRLEALVLPSPVLFGMPATGSQELSISQDRKSLIFRKAGWTWTFTPTPVAAK